MDKEFTKYLLAASKELGRPQSAITDIKGAIVNLGTFFMMFSFIYSILSSIITGKLVIEHRFIL